MSGDPNSPSPGAHDYDVAEAGFDVAEQTAATPGGVVVDGESEDEETKRRQDAALASTFDPALAKSGKTDEEIDKQKHDDALLIEGAAIVTAVIVAESLHEHHQQTDDANTEHGAQHDVQHDAHGDGG